MVTDRPGTGWQTSSILHASYWFQLKGLCLIRRRSGSDKRQRPRLQAGERDAEKDPIGVATPQSEICVSDILKAFYYSVWTLRFHHGCCFPEPFSRSLSWPRRRWKRRASCVVPLLSLQIKLRTDCFSGRAIHCCCSGGGGGGKAPPSNTETLLWLLKGSWILTNN